MPAPVINHIGEANGLSDNAVTAILKDSRGLLWVGTADGLNVLDGSINTIYKNKSGDSNSISGNAIKCLAEDAAHNIWIGNANGLSCLNYSTQQFQNYAANIPPFGQSPEVTALHIDPQNRVWFLTKGYLGCINGASKKIFQYHIAATQTKDDRLANIFSSMLVEGDSIWLTGYEGLWIFNKTLKKFTQKTSQQSDAAFDFYSTINRSKDGRLWIGSWSRGLKEYVAKTDRIINYENLPDAQNNITQIEEINLPSYGNVLMLNGSFFCFDAHKNTFLQMAKPLQLVDYPDINIFYTSKDGWLWMGSENGLYVFDPAHQQIKHHFFGGNISTQNVSFLERKNGLLMGGQAAGFLVNYNDTFGVLHNWSAIRFTSNEIKDNNFASLLSLAADADSQHIWLSSSLGVGRLNTIDGKTEWWSHTEADSATLPRNFVPYVLPIEKGIVWAFPWREGIWEINTQTGKCRQLLKGLSPQGNSVKGMLISDAVQDEAGNIWMTDLDEGILFFDKKQNRFSKPLINTIGAFTHTARIYLRNGWLYTIANQSIIKWNPKTLETHLITLPAEMQKAVYDFAPDHNSNWWITTHGGLVLWREKEQSFRRFTEADGLVKNDMNGNLFCRNNGTMLFATDNYISSFNPTALAGINNTTARLQGRGIWVNGYYLSTFSDTSFTLTYQQNNLMFRWSVTDYNNPFSNQYYYKLSGSDSSWHYTGNKGEVQFASLEPGNYVLQLKGIASNGSEADNMLTLKYIIKPPFYKSAWFRLLLALFIIAGVFIIFKIRLAAVRREASWVKMKAEAEMRALRAQMNPHFIFNSLNSIQECIVMKNTDAAYTYLAKFSKLVRRILENSGKQFVPLQEEIELLEWYVSLEQLRFATPVAFSVNAEKTIDIYNTHIPSMVIQPYVENALWHGLANKQGDKKLSVNFAEKDGMICCTITDNGIGRNAADKITANKTNDKKSMGMQLSNERLKLVSAQAKVEIEDLYDANATPSGTRVIIYLPKEG